MLTDILRTIAGVEVFPILSLVVFVTVFAVVLVRAARADGAELAALAELPLEGTDSRDPGARATGGGRDT